MSKPQKIYSENIEQGALDQFESAMALPNIVRGALMPDAHLGYSLPIGGVVASKGIIYPSFVGYDIGCGMSAICTSIKKEDILSSATLLTRSNSKDEGIYTIKGAHTRIFCTFDEELRKL